MMRVKVYLRLIVCLLSGLSGLISSCPAEEAKRPVRIAYFHGGRVHGVYRTFMYSYFEKEGVDVELYTQYLYGREFIKIPKDHKKMMAESYKSLGRVSGRNIIKAIEDGVTDGGTPGESSFIEAVEREAPIVAVALLGYDTKTNPGKGFLLRRDVVINKPEDFKGRTFGTRRAGPGDKIFLSEFFKSIGLDPEKDVTIIDQIPDDQLVIYLKERKIDGYLFHLHAGILTIESGDAYLYQPMNWMNPEISCALLVFHKDYVAKHPDEVRKVLRAFMKRIKDEHNLPKDEKVKVEDFGLQMIREYKGMNLPQYKFPPLVPVDLMEEAQELLLEYKAIDKKVDLKKFIDNSFVQELYEELK